MCPQFRARSKMPCKITDPVAQLRCDECNGTTKTASCRNKLSEITIGGSNTGTLLTKFTGRVDSLNAMLKALSKVEGVAIAVKFAKKSALQKPIADHPNVEMLGYNWEFDHNGMVHVETLTITINLTTMDVENLELPTLRGIEESTKE